MEDPSVSVSWNDLHPIAEKPHLESQRPVTMGYFQSTLGFFQSIMGYFQSLLGYFQSLLGFFQSLLGFFQSLLGFFQANMGYFQSNDMSSVGCSLGPLGVPGSSQNVASSLASGSLRQILVFQTQVSLRNLGRLWEDGVRSFLLAFRSVNESSLAESRLNSPCLHLLCQRSRMKGSVPYPSSGPQIWPTLHPPTTPVYNATVQPGTLTFTDLRSAGRACQTVYRAVLGSIADASGASKRLCSSRDHRSMTTESSRGVIQICTLYAKPYSESAKDGRATLRIHIAVACF